MAAHAAIPTPYADDVEILCDLGYLPVPIHAGRKNPIVAGWRTLTREEAIALAEVHPHASIGVRCDNVRAVDVDITDAEIAGLIEAWLIKNVVKDGDALIRIGQAPKFAMLFAASGSHPKRVSATFVDPGDPNPKSSVRRIETLGEGQQIVLSGIHPTTGKPYTWKDGGPISRQVATYELPKITDAQLDALDQYYFDTVSSLRKHWRHAQPASAARGAQQGDLQAPFAVAGLTLDMAREALSCVPNDDLPYEQWLDAGMSLHHQEAGDVEWFALWDEWSANSSKYTGERANWKRWESFNANKPGGRTMRSILMQAEGNGWTRPASVEGARVEDAVFPSTDEEENPGSHNSDTNVPPEDVDTPRAEEGPTVAEDGFLEVDIDDLGMADVPPAQFIVDPYLPERVATILGAHGGSGKSRLALQLAVHVAMGIDFANHKVKRAKVIVYSAEDDVYTLRRRIQAITRHLEVDPVALSQWLMVLDVTEIDPALFRETSGRGGVRTGTYTDAFKSLYRRSHKFQAGMVIIDNSSDVFDANENERVRVRAFVRMLGTLARKLQGAVLLVMHVNRNVAKGGEGTEGYSGSTAWHNSARSRMFLRKDDDTYLLEHQKANFSAPAEPLQMVFQPVGSEAVMVPVDQAEWLHDERRQAKQDDDQAVLDALQAAIARGANVTTAPSGPLTSHKALEDLDELPDGMEGGAGKKRFKEALNRLERAGRITREKYQNAYRNDRERWVICVSSKGREEGRWWES